MSFRFRRVWFVALLAALLTGNLARAANEGQEDLDLATEKKLAADNLDDLAKVIDLCQSAVAKGLDNNNTAFANSLLTSALMQRATITARNIGERQPAGWQQLRTSALTDLEQALKVDPTLAAAHFLIARLQSLPGGDKAAALKAAEQAFELSKDKLEMQVQALVLQANLQDALDKKLEFLNQALKLAPNNQEALRSRGMFYLETQKPAEAAADLEAASKNDSDNPEIYLARGFAYLMLKRNDDAVEAFSQAAKFAPDSAVPYLHRARAYAQDKKTKEALEDIEHALKIDPDNVAALLMRAQVHQLAGDSKSARADLDEALNGRPGFTPALELRGAISAGSGDYAQAIDDFEQLRKVAPKSAELLGQLGILYAANKQPRKAIERYSDALANNPDALVALRGRADAYLNVGKHAEAVTDYNAALKLKPQDSSILNNLAWVLATSPDDKVRNGKRSVELGAEAAKVTDYKQAHILSTLAAGYAESGDFEKAKEWSQKAVELGSDDAETATQLKKELASYGEKKPWREMQIQEENTPPAKAGDSASTTKKLPEPPPPTTESDSASR